MDPPELASEPPRSRIELRAGVKRLCFSNVRARSLHERTNTELKISKWYWLLMINEWGRTDHYTVCLISVGGKFMWFGIWCGPH